MGIMKQREEYVANEIRSAEKSRAGSSKLLEEQRDLLKEARTEAQELIENAKKQGEFNVKKLLWQLVQKQNI